MASDDRRLRILQIIKQNQVSKQEQLVDLLNNEGYDVTQATVSRDIRELKLQKVRENGFFRYVYNDENAVSDTHTVALFKQTVTAINRSVNILVINTLPGSANAVCAIVDKMNIPEILGTVAGDDCLFAVAASAEVAPSVEAKLKSYLK